MSRPLSQLESRVVRSYLIRTSDGREWLGDVGGRYRTLRDLCREIAHQSRAPEGSELEVFRCEVRGGGVLHQVEEDPVLVSWPFERMEYDEVEDWVSRYFEENRVPEELGQFIRSAAARQESRNTEYVEAVRSLWEQLKQALQAYSARQNR